LDAKPKRRREPEKKARAIVFLDKKAPFDANPKRSRKPEARAVVVLDRPLLMQRQRDTESQRRRRGL
jgi:hypothetical protein